MMSKAEEYQIVVLRLTDEDGGGYYGFVPDLPGCSSDGETRVEAIVNLEDALNEWLHVQGERGAVIPEPGEATRAAVKEIDQLLNDLQELIEFKSSAEEKISQLERKIAEWAAVRRDDPATTGYPSFDHEQLNPKRRAH